METVYVYQDLDNSIIEVFSTLKAAKSFAISMNPDQEEWEEHKESYFLPNGYVSIRPKKVNN
jgi:hypothetical protein